MVSLAISGLAASGLSPKGPQVIYIHRASIGHPRGNIAEEQACLQRSKGIKLQSEKQQEDGKLIHGVLRVCYVSLRHFIPIFIIDSGMENMLYSTYRMEFQLILLKEPMSLMYLWRRETPGFIRKGDIIYRMLSALMIKGGDKIYVDGRGSHYLW